MSHRNRSNSLLPNPLPMGLTYARAEFYANRTMVTQKILTKGTLTFLMGKMFHVARIRLDL